MGCALKAIFRAHKAPYKDDFYAEKVTLTVVLGDVAREKAIIFAMLNLCKEIPNYFCALSEKSKSV